jgi:choline dehydrogenase-like flavoprotein
METTSKHDLPAIFTPSEEFFKHDYDFVVVGGGTAGLIIAVPLSGNPSIQVGVLEAGPPTIGDLVIMIP